MSSSASASRDESPAMERRKSTRTAAVQQPSLAENEVAIDYGGFLDSKGFPLYGEGDPSVVVKGKEITETWLAKHFTRPVYVASPKEVGIQVPRARKTPAKLVQWIAKITGTHVKLPVIDVTTQNMLEPPWTLKQWSKYVGTPIEKRSALLNVISLEISKLPLKKHVHAPKIVHMVDWADTVFPRLPAPVSGEEPQRPNVQYYCLMGSQGSYTDFHIDFGGSSVWYHIVMGQKVFYFAPPTPANLAAYEKWCLSPEQDSVFFGDMLEPGEVQKAVVNQGMTILIPSGWIHAVYTPVDSVVFGGNYLHFAAMDMQIQIYHLENRTAVGAKFRYPLFQQANWYAARHLANTQAMGLQQPGVTPNALRSLIGLLRQWTRDGWGPPEDIKDEALVLRRLETMLLRMEGGSTNFIFDSTAQSTPAADALISFDGLEDKTQDWTVSMSDAELFGAAAVNGASKKPLGGDEDGVPMSIYASSDAKPLEEFQSLSSDDDDKSLPSSPEPEPTNDSDWRPKMEGGVLVRKKMVKKKSVPTPTTPTATTAEHLMQGAAQERKQKMPRRDQGPTAMPRPMPSRTFVRMSIDRQADLPPGSGPPVNEFSGITIPKKRQFGQWALQHTLDSGRQNQNGHVGDNGHRPDDRRPDERRPDERRPDDRDRRPDDRRDDRDRRDRDRDRDWRERDRDRGDRDRDRGDRDRDRRDMHDRGRDRNSDSRRRDSASRGRDDWGRAGQAAGLPAFPAPPQVPASHPAMVAYQQSLAAAMAAVASAGGGPAALDMLSSYSSLASGTAAPAPAPASAYNSYIAAAGLTQPSPYAVPGVPSAPLAAGYGGAPASPHGYAAAAGGWPSSALPGYGSGYPGAQATDASYSTGGPMPTHAAASVPAAWQHAAGALAAVTPKAEATAAATVVGTGAKKETDATRKRTRDVDAYDPEAEYAKWERDREKERAAERKREREREELEERERIRAREAELARQLADDEPESKRRKYTPYDPEEALAAAASDHDEDEIVAPSEFVPEEDRVVIKVRKKWSWA